MLHLGTSVRLGDILRKATDRIRIDASKTYQELTVKLNGKGVVARRLVPGTSIRGDIRAIARAGQLILSRIDARNGAIAVVPENMDGAIVSNDFPCFRIDTSRVVPAYLHWTLQAPVFLERLQQASSGTTNRVRLDTQAFLDTAIPMLSLDAQEKRSMLIQRTVERVEASMQLQLTASNAAERLVARSTNELVIKLNTTSPSRSLAELLKRSRNTLRLDASAVYSGVGTRMWGLGTYVHEQKRGNEFEAERYSVALRQLIYNEVWAHKGAIGIVGDLGDNLVVSRHFHVFDVDWSLLRPEYLQRLFQSNWFWSQCEAGSVGTTGRGHMRRGHIMGIRIPTPSLEEQAGFVSKLKVLQGQVQKLRDLQAKANAKVSAVLPAILDTVFE